LPRRPRLPPESRTCGTHLQSPPLTKEHRRARLLPGALASAFLVVARVAFSASTTTSLAIGIARLVMSAGVAYEHRRRRIHHPRDMTIERWRRLRRSTAPTQRDPWSRLVAAARRVGRRGERRCDHLHDTVSRYDHAAKRLELLLTCPVCETEKVIHSLPYEPRFEPSVASVHALHAREGAAVDALDRAA
jgi:ribosomal protein L44E